MRAAAVLVLLAGALVSTPQLGASVFVATGVARPALSVDAKGTALVSWVQGGARRSVVVPARGQLAHGGSLAGPDVSKAARVGGLGPAIAVRRIPDGRYWALQAWPQTPGGPVDLHLARWDGAPTELTLAFDGTRLTGRVTFHGRPVTGTSLTLEGKRVRIYVYLDCLGCPAGRASWARMIGVAPKADGSFAAFVRPEWRGRRYRAWVMGPNLGTTLAPDAQATVEG